jgi:hypothetical protein
LSLRGNSLSRMLDLLVVGRVSATPLFSLRSPGRSSGEPIGARRRRCAPYFNPVTDPAFPARAAGTAPSSNPQRRSPAPAGCPSGRNRTRQIAGDEPMRWKGRDSAGIGVFACVVRTTVDDNRAHPSLSNASFRLASRTKATRGIFGRSFRNRNFEGRPVEDRPLLPKLRLGTGNQKNAMPATQHRTFCVGSSAPLGRSCSASALHARSRFPVSRRTVVTMGPRFPIAILPGIVAELGRIF